MKKFDAVDVLLVEDNPRDAELTIRALKKKNFANDIYLVEDGVEALDFLFCRGKYVQRNIADTPKVILLDLKLPKLSGLEVLREIKSDEKTHAIPVVVLTSSNQDPDIKLAYDLGANSYVVKPVDFNAFVDAIGSLGFYWLLINRGIK